MANFYSKLFEHPQGGRLENSKGLTYNTDILSLQTTSFITTHESKTDEYDIVIDQNNPFKMSLALYKKTTPKQVLAQFEPMKISP